MHKLDSRCILFQKTYFDIMTGDICHTAPDRLSLIFYLLNKINCASLCKSVLFKTGHLSASTECIVSLLYKSISCFYVGM